MKNTVIHNLTQRGTVPTDVGTVRLFRADDGENSMIDTYRALALPTGFLGALGSAPAIVFSGKYIDKAPMPEQLWVLWHEIGHLVLRHKVSTIRNEIDADMYSVKQGNCPYAGITFLNTALQEEVQKQVLSPAELLSLKRMTLARVSALKTILIGVKIKTTITRYINLYIRGLQCSI